MIKVLENPFYYLENFHQVLAWIGERYDDLLNADERHFLTTFPALPQSSRALFVRMVMRKGTVFRASKLVYAEIGSTHEAARPLAELGLIEEDPQLCLEELFDLLQKPEIVKVFQLGAHVKHLRKADQLEALREEYSAGHRFSGWYANSGDHVYRNLTQELCDRLRLIFFGNYHQDWTEFVLSDLGIYQYEKVEFSPAARGFRSRRDIDDFLAIHRCHERFAEGEEPAAVIADLPSCAADNEWLRSRRSKLVFAIAQHVEKLADWPAAHALYADCDYPGARARAIRVLEKNAQPREAFELLQTAMLAPESEAERQQLLRMAPRLARKLGHVKPAPVSLAQAERIDLSLPPPEEASYVEFVVRDHLSRDDAPVYYVENSLMNSLFGLLCWEAVFSPIPGAFFHPYHRGPADLHSADFQRRRALQFSTALSQLDGEHYRATIRANYAAKYGLQSPFLYWEAIDEDLLDLALDCIPPLHLKRAFERILLDIKANRSGFPDLIQFWPAERRYNMIEVKGPGDRLQDNQLRWIAYCAAHQMPISVCYLQWAA
ncbi:MULTISPECIES: VRR-NUC domain-containing protein [unclassified Duganella]|uniref:VRR-NUC domain-containing protein n=1 Tax=unclassified Duganella TaxID=2636909 RepID=UPI00087DF8A7|nr:MULTISPECIES: VRR-NUC domain-containing protein [unclassified Duganella]SDG40059.1 VRR-NUC domain-containing protein [Duganella sp. OV458]SDJ63803.1 VRR-NUC domain-containing protein [Duganella sp. OV510]